MESTTQPILCCVGATVAGCPTQFLMERAFAARGLDWRAISVEVPAHLLSVAIDGMAAMNFKALRLYPSLYDAAVQALGEANPLAQFVGSATSAALTDKGWQAWDHYGFSALKLANEKLELAQCVCWLHGDSRQTRSVAAALYELRQSNQPTPSRIFWTDRPASLPEELRLLGILDDQATLLADVLSAASQSLPDESEPQSLKDPAHSNHPQDERAQVMRSGDKSGELLGDRLLFVENSETLSDLPLETLQFAERTHVFSSGPVPHRLLSLPTLLFVPEVDIAIAAEVYDFQRWTEQPPDCGLFRDAYEEFCAF